MSDSVANTLIGAVAGLASLVITQLIQGRAVRKDVVEVRKSVDGLLEQRVDAAKAQGNLTGRSEQTAERIAAKGDPL